MDSMPGGVTFSGGEPLLQIDKMQPIIKTLKENQISVVVESSLYVPQQLMQASLEWIDLFYADIKILDKKKAQSVEGGDLEMFLSNFEEAHIRTYLEKDGVETRVDMHLRKSKSKGIAIDGQKIKKAADLMGLCNVVFFSPEDLGIIKNGPAERRRFVDMELCQLDSFYLYNLNHYNKIVNQRNKLLKDMYLNPDLRETLSIWDMQLVSFGNKIIERRKLFEEQLNEIIYGIHKKLSGDKEELTIHYEPDVKTEEFEKKLKYNQERDIKSKMTSVGPHRDDFSFVVGDIDIRKFGSQGQQRTAALSLKLSEIELVKKLTKDTPVLLLDDVLSELDSNRQNYLLNSIGDIQTIITCTGLEEFVNHRFEIDKVYRVAEGTVSCMNQV